jgi:hypothetical protein
MVGLIAGLMMGIALFVSGEIAAFVIYGSQFAPGQISAWHFLWAKLVIGGFFGIFFGVIFAKLPSSVRGEGILSGLYYGFWI